MNRSFGVLARASWVVLFVLFVGCTSSNPSPPPTDAQPKDLPTASDITDDFFDAPPSEQPPLDVGCPAGMTLCAGQCVDLATSNDHCGACETRCPAGTACSRAEDGGAPSCRTVCPMNQTLCGDVCATTATDPQNCGACGRDCAREFANAAVACMGGSCRLTACLPDFADCDGMQSTGCEINTNGHSEHCGGCGAACALANATAMCTNGRCAISTCSAGFADCNMNPADGCEADTRTSVAHCGGCGMMCTAPVGRGASCVAGACMVSETCSSPDLGDCDGMPGCETNLTTSVMHCGACGRPCSGNGGTPTCGGSPPRCSITCNAGLADCDGDVSTGCETNTATSAMHCGRCGNACSLSNAASSCTGGACRVASCNAGFANCDGRDDNGCEQAIQTSSANCGACGNACTGGQTCQSGMCACPAGQTLCGGACVDLMTSAGNCGACGRACGGSCQGGACVSSARAVVSCGTTCQRPLDAVPDSAASAVYFTAFTPTGEPAVYRATIPATGMPPAAPTLLIAGAGMEFPAGIVISNDDTTLYVVDPIADRGTDATTLGIGAIIAVSVSSGAVRVLDVDTGLVHPQAVTLTSDGEALLVSAQSRDASGDLRPGIFRVARAGGALPMVVTASVLAPAGVSQGPAPANSVVALDLRAVGPSLGRALNVPSSGAPTLFAPDLVANHPAGIALALDGRGALISAASLGGGGAVLTWVASDGRVASTPELSTSMVTPVGLHRARTVDLWTVADEAAGDTGQIFLFTPPR